MRQELYDHAQADTAPCRGPCGGCRSSAARPRSCRLETGSTHLPHSTSLHGRPAWLARLNSTGSTAHAEPGPSSAWASASVHLRTGRTSLVTRGLAPRALPRGAPLTGRPHRSGQLRGMRLPSQPCTQGALHGVTPARTSHTGSAGAQVSRDCLVEKFAAPDEGGLRHKCTPAKLQSV